MLGQDRALTLNSLVPDASTSAVGQCGIDALDQSALFERLMQVSNRAVSISARAQSLVRKCGYEYHGDIMTIGNQMVIQFDSAQTGHLDVSDEAGRSRNMGRFEEFRGRTKRHRVIAERPDKGLCGFPYGFIVVNDRDHGHLLQFCVSGSVA
jgi:hypothetical protein